MFNYSKFKALDTLNLPENSTNDEIKKAYKIAALKWHPDKNKDNIELATTKFKEITDAYKLLTDNKQTSIFSSIFEEIIKSEFQFENRHMSEEDEINNEAEELFNYLRCMESSSSLDNIYVFGPKEPVKKKEKALRFRVKINIYDIWKNTLKRLPVKKKYTINLPLYYSHITFINNVNDPSLNNIKVEIVDKYENEKIKRKGKWDIEILHDINLLDLYKDDVIVNIKLIDNSDIFIKWKKEYINNIKNKMYIILYNLGFLKPDNSRGNVYVKFNIILPVNLNVVNNVNNEDVSKPEYLIPEWIDIDNIEDTKRDIILKLKDFL